MAANQLGKETSPYLLQHAGNPVAWLPWGEAALAQAQVQDKPIMLSIGYAACHWCHVMAHESFEDKAIAALMNELFVNIKVDREERPDLDAIYQSALALMGEHGGWPLTMFCTPAGEPFWGGTYFPPAARFGRAGFPDVLRQVARIYRSESDKITQNVSALRDALARLSQPQQAGIATLADIGAIAEKLAGNFDPEHGGLRGAPKFPQPSLLRLLWLAHTQTGAAAVHDAVTLSLDKMAQGGIYDHLGGGFARYSVDDVWLVPHFEKMLYDNAQLVELYTLAWQETASALHAQRVAETVDWVLRDMVNADSGAFSATLDADSEGVEGKYYVWTPDEIDALLGADAAAFKAAYDVRDGGNWEGTTILNRSHAPAFGDPAAEARLAQSRAILLQAREQRIPPGLDDKVLADWNGQMIAALTRASQAFDQPAWLTAALRAYTFVAEAMQTGGRLMHVWRAGLLKNAGTLDDYANMCRAALDLHEAMGDGALVRQAEAWVATLDRHYWDDAHGGYFFTADDARDLITRTKSAADNAVPAGNGTLVEVLARLYLLTGEDRYRARAEAIATAFAGEVQRHALPFATLLVGAASLQDALQIVVVGDRAAADTKALLATINAASLPVRALMVVAPAAALHQGHPAAGKGQIDRQATAYLCRGPVCSAPVTEPTALAAALRAR